MIFINVPNCLWCYHTHQATSIICRLAVTSLSTLWLLIRYECAGWMRCVVIHYLCLLIAHHLTQRITISRACQYVFEAKTRAEKIAVSNILDGRIYAVSKLGRRVVPNARYRMKKDKTKLNTSFTRRWTTNILTHRKAPHTCNASSDAVIPLSGYLFFNRIRNSIDFMTHSFHSIL